MKKNYIILFVLLAPISLFAQISKNQWLVGGSFVGHYQKNDFNNSTEKEIKTPIDIGYFVANKLALGLRGQFSYLSTTQPLVLLGVYYYPSVKQKETAYAFGPFIRYYLLPKANRFNLYGEAYYSNGSGKLTMSGTFGDNVQVSKYNVNTFNFNLAPVFIINQHTSAELIAGYYLQKRENSTASLNTFLVGLGLQIHLGNPGNKDVAK